MRRLMIDPPHAMPITPPDYDAFLARHLRAQSQRLACHELEGRQVWLWRAAPSSHRALALVARLSHTPALRPLAPTRAPADLAAELQQLQAQGVRTPRVLACHASGLLMRMPGDITPNATTLDAALHAAALEGADRVLALWQRGLALMGRVHASGLSLGGTPASTLLADAQEPLICAGLDASASEALAPELRQVRDALAYLWATAGHLHQAGLRETARPLWRDWVAHPARGDAFRGALAQHLSRLSWLRYLPPDSRWGTSIYQMRAAYELATTPRYGADEA